MTGTFSRTPPEPPELFAVVLPLAVKWADDEQRNILQQGQPLTREEEAAAKLAGVLHRGRVRLLFVPQIPAPEHRLLKYANNLLQFVTSKTAGLTLESGISSGVIVQEIADFRDTSAFTPLSMKAGWDQKLLGAVFE